ncbi:hypothetical protein [Paenibacillus apiarius]|uniref:Uncharacterized protein n=1 Tax=Paenibacillus apiarius TaxID=46240 RepID=A0ABT4DPI8_9BACL|nr:hypothetical protein [Paenibacillus apiarius]MCY9517259.1 hypothetical protein [Paenibacillus apiarius]MCY9519146.1 hypothetical protein [Paenibacillus apiarius]MCY9551071.1 hypothetical protein [Paenibacillus apiarius]MCY9560058.1 hypothetical protein [Paenibacillus apiarius]MCY9683299.1 hypothetical protein [Paenibacillus apiarius]
MSENHPDPSFRGFSRRQDSIVHSPALDALRQLKDDATDQSESKIDHLSNMKTKTANHQGDLSAHEMAAVAAVSPSIAEDEDRSLPSRKELYPSDYAKLTNWFYNILFLLFIGLLVGLLLWGRHKMALEG